MTWRPAHRRRVIALVGALVATAGALGPAMAGPAANVASCRTDLALGPPVPVAVVLGGASEVTEDEADALLAQAVQGVEVLTRVVVEPTADAPGPGGPDEREEEQQPTGPAEEWKPAASVSEIALELDRLADGVPAGIVALVIGDQPTADELLRSTGPRVAVADRAVTDGGTTGDDVAAIVEQAEVRLGQGVLDLRRPEVRRTADGYVIDLAGRLRSTSITATVASAIDAEGEALAVDPCTAALQMPLVIAGEDLDGAVLSLALTAPDGASVPATVELEPDVPEVDVPTTTEASDDERQEREQPDDDDDDDERASGAMTSSSDGSGGTSPVVPVVGGMVLLAGLAAVAVVLNRNRAQPVAFAGGPSAPPGPMAAQAAAPPAPPPPPPAPAATDPAWVATDGDDPVMGLAAAATPVAGRVGENGTTWAFRSGDSLFLGGWNEKIPGHGEDAAPLLQVHADGSAIVGVFDGTGGAGSSVARREADGSTRTGAWVGSRLAREVTADWLVSARTGAEDPATPSLQERLRSWMHVVHEASGETTVVRGSLHRSLPTTLAALAVTPAPGGARLDVLWAGDSRCYTLRPDVGLQVLTRDDTREGDALALIRDDQPMLNLVSADRPFRINHSTRTVARPAVVVAATDGCFGYLPTPAHFELVLLDSLARSTTADEWADTVLRRLGRVAGDDVSFAIACLGVTDLEPLKTVAAARLAHLHEVHAQPFRGVTDPSELDRLRQQSWDAYRGSYEAELGEGSR